MVNSGMNKNIFYKQKRSEYKSIANSRMCKNKRCLVKIKKSAKQLDMFRLKM